MTPKKLCPHCRSKDVRLDFNKDIYCNHCKKSYPKPKESFDRKYERIMMYIALIFAYLFAVWNSSLLGNCLSSPYLSWGLFILISAIMIFASRSIERRYGIHSKK